MKRTIQDSRSCCSSRSRRYSIRDVIRFLKPVILKNILSNLDHLKLICTNISHSIMTVVRPRSFKSKLQLGLSVFIIDALGQKIVKANRVPIVNHQKKRIHMIPMSGPMVQRYFSNLFAPYKKNKKKEENKKKRKQKY